MTGLHVLCVDPDEDARAELCDGIRADLADFDPTVETRSTLADVGLGADIGAVDCVVTEYRLPDGTGLELAGRVRETNPDTTVVLFTGTPHHEVETDDDDPVVTEFVDKRSSAAVTRVTSLLEMTAVGGGQLSYPLPDDEDGRLAALEAYESDAPGLADALDRITDLAVGHFGVERASINLIEEHEQRLMACKGMGTSTESVPREDSICTFTIVADERVMTVADVREDSRFESRHGDLEALGVRSYMGAQVVAPGAFPIGTVCIYDDVPREFTAEERDYIRTLADLARDLLVASTGGHRGDHEGEPGTAAGGEGDVEDGADGDDDLSPAEEAFQ